MERVRVSVCTLFVGNSDLPDPNIKYLLERERERESAKGRREGEEKNGVVDSRQAVVKLGELTMAALFPPPLPVTGGVVGVRGGGGWGCLVSKA